MNIHYQCHTPWAEAEVAALMSLTACGKTYADIAQVLGRSTIAVKDKVKRLRYGGPAPAPPVAPPTVTIPRAALPVWYALGWRVEKFDATHCFLVWPHRSTARMP